MRPARHAAVVLVALTGALITLAGPAHAHGRATDATNYDSTVTEAPALEGVEWAVYGGDALLSVTNTTDTALTVFGYDGEPYLRIGPDGVWRNQRSPAAYLNEDRYGQVTLPPDADADAPPDWERVSDQASHAWHDHRIHFMAPRRPAAIDENPDVEQVVPGYERWEVPFAHGETEYVVAGELSWVPAPSPWPWLAAGAVLVLPALAGAKTHPRLEAPGPEGGRWPGLARPAAVVLGVVAAANVSRIIDDVVAVPLPATETALAAALTTLFTAAGGYGAWRGWRGTHADLFAMGAGGVLLGVGQGLVSLPVLTSSQLATVFADAFARALVAASLAQTLVVVGVAWWGSRRLRPTVPDARAGERAAAAGPPDAALGASSG